MARKTAHAILMANVAPFLSPPVEGDVFPISSLITPTTENECLVVDGRITVSGFELGKTLDFVPRAELLPRNCGAPEAPEWLTKFFVMKRLQAVTLDSVDVVLTDINGEHSLTFTQNIGPIEPGYPSTFYVPDTLPMGLTLKAEGDGLIMGVKADEAQAMLAWERYSGGKLTVNMDFSIRAVFALSTDPDKREGFMGCLLEKASHASPTFSREYARWLSLLNLDRYSASAEDSVRFGFNHPTAATARACIASAGEISLHVGDPITSIHHNVKPAAKVTLPASRQWPDNQLARRSGRTKVKKP